MCKRIVDRVLGKVINFAAGRPGSSLIAAFVLLASIPWTARYLSGCIAFISLVIGSILLPIAYWGYRGVPEDL